MGGKYNFSIVGIVGVPANYGGFETLAENLLGNQDPKIRVYCSSKSYDNKLQVYKNADLKYVNLSANGVQSIFYDMYSLIHSCLSREKRILVLGVSGAMIFPLLKLLFRPYLVTNIDGLEWKRQKWNKWASAFLKLSERIAVRFSDKVIADNQGIADYVQSEYGVSAEVIAYGGDHVLVESDDDLIVDHGKYALALCRIEPENNVRMILESFVGLDFKLKFIGNWDKSEFGRTLKNEFGKYANIELIDPIYDQKVLANYRRGAKFYLHGHSAGGTNPSLVEMMNFGIPVLAFDCIYNQATLEGKSHYFNSTQELRVLIEKNKDLDLNSLSESISEIAKRRYTWATIKKSYHKLFIYGEDKIANLAEEQRQLVFENSN